MEKEMKYMIKVSISSTNMIAWYAYDGVSAYDKCDGKVFNTREDAEHVLKAKLKTKHKGVTFEIKEIEDDDR